MTEEELYGQDILLDDAMQAVITANGEAAVSGGIRTVLQDIKLRLFTPLGSLFYDADFGSEIIEYVKEENTPGTRLSLAAEVKRRINMDPRVKFGTVSCEILSWDHLGITLLAKFGLIGESNPFNLIIEIGADLEMVIKDVNPNQ